MDELYQTTNQDRAIETDEDDQLDRSPFIDNLVRALILDEIDDEGDVLGRRATGYVVGLTGRWGLGKSSVLNLLNHKLDSMNHVIVANFNPWLFKGRDELVSGFFSSLRDAMGHSPSEKTRALVASVDSYWGAIDLAGHGVAAVLDINGGTGMATSLWTKWAQRLRLSIPKPELRTPDEERLALEKKIVEANCAVVVLVDELDRVEDDEVRAVAQLVKALGDIKGISYLVAYDPERVVQALGRGSKDERRESGERYLEKIIQHPIPLRPLFPDDTKILLEVALANHGLKLTLETARTDRQQAMFDHLVGTIDTPREVKRLVGAFSVLEQAVRGEICPYDVLGYCWILTKSPGIRDQIAARVDELVSDPSEQGMSDWVIQNLDNKGNPSVADVLGEEAAEVHKKTLELLFPRLGEGAASGVGERLSRRRNLVRLLYLGDPPGMIRRGDLEALWSNPDLAELETELRRMMDEEKLASAIDRLDDILPTLPEAGDQTFWVALSRAFLRRSDWLDGPEAARALADDAANNLYRMCQNDPAQTDRFRRALDALIADDDLILVPFILRKLLFAHGLTSYSDDRRGDYVLDVKETQELLVRELARYRVAVLNGSVLRRVPNVEAIYVILNSQNWDSELRASLTSQLCSIEATSTLAALLTPPGHSIDRATLDELFDARAVHAIIDGFIANSAVSTNPWILTSFRRLQTILAGKNPIFDDK